MSPSLELVCSSVPLSIIKHDRWAPACTGLNLWGFYCRSWTKSWKLKAWQSSQHSRLRSDLCGSLRPLWYCYRSAKDRNHHSKHLSPQSEREVLPLFSLISSTRFSSRTQHNQHGAAVTGRIKGLWQNQHTVLFSLWLYLCGWDNFSPCSGKAQNQEGNVKTSASLYSPKVPYL